LRRRGRCLDLLFLLLPHIGLSPFLDKGDEMKTLREIKFWIKKLVFGLRMFLLSRQAKGNGVAVLLFHGWMFPDRKKIKELDRIITERRKEGEDLRAIIDDLDTKGMLG